MAISKSFFGLRTGSTKNHTYSIYDGKQVTKERVEHVKNPRSLAQMRQRMFMVTAGLAYSNMNNIVDHSFEGLTYGARNMNRFMQLNLDKIRRTAGQTPTQFSIARYKYDYLCPGAYVVSEGSLPSKSESFINLSGTSYTDTDLNLGGFAYTGANPTLGDFKAHYGVQGGDMLTVVAQVGDADNISAAVEGWLGEVKFGILRLHIPTSADTTEILSSNFADLFQIESIGLTAAIAASDSRADISIDVDADWMSAACIFSAAMIHSRKADSKWLRSTESLIVHPAVVNILISEFEAIDTYPIGTEYILNGADFR